MIKYLSSSSDEKVESTHQVGTVLGSRLSSLEHQFSAFRNQSDLDFATQQELNDWNENRATERFFVLTGLAPAPAKLSGGYFACCF